MIKVDSCFISYLLSHPSDSEATGDSAAIPVEVRLAQSQDLKSLAEILADSFFPTANYWSFLRPIFKLGIYEDLRGRLRGDTPYYHCLVVSQTSVTATGSQEVIVATAEISLKSSSFLAVPIPYISNLAVSPDRRRAGLARRLLLKCEQIAREWGFEELSLHVLDNNLAAQSLYLSSGYRLQKTDGWLINWLFNRPQKLFLHKKISQ
ncbi:MAG: GNAT family N-acetyltransferase [Microcystis sp. M015S2]|uniref:GNAT family N-acetyltransferase n=1 Tax=unclassified Microcystis TaxID=2643300 RepID=UPI0025900982|nr:MULTISPECIES: GNAT family N-acetyltransferase [unclassified Microcystis]MCA2711137.1 GNAT family N-acetyltransferase [Microcystis sp. M025S2]MCA2743045.1 GNAT family N-acetyltransferase [Microcystis sp. M015S2]MCA2759832.1 GNAT family N-acetyltransferase [Microcystis sp. M145S2]